MSKRKCRVWDNDFKTMHYLTGDMHDTICFMGNKLGYHNLQNGGGSGETYSDIMFTTGDLTINGEDVYDGDFVTGVVDDNGKLTQLQVVGNVHQNKGLLDKEPTE